MTAGIYSIFDQQQRQALDHARALAAAGVPIFIAKPARDRHGDWLPDSGAGGCGYWLPQGWQHTKADPATIDAWEPGDALAAVMGHGLDLLDVDPRSGGDDTLAGLRGAGIVPTTYAEAATPSGGWHGFVASLGVGSRDGIAPGVDVKAGTPQGDGRGFAFISPTVRLSKSTGELTAYRWTSPPDLDRYTLEAAEDDTGQALADLVRAARGERTPQPGTGATGALSTVSDALAPSPLDDVPATLAEGRHRGVHKLASALRGRGGWRLEDALAYMRAVVFPQIDQGQGGHPYTLAELEADVRDVFDRYEDGRRGTAGTTDDATENELAFNRAVNEEATRLRVREAARHIVTRENAPPPAPLDAGTLADILARDPEPPYRVDGLIPSDAGTLVVAQRKTGKTTFNLNLARSLITGEPFLDTFQVRPITGNVAILNFEVGGAQLARWADEAGIDHHRLYIVNLRGRRNPFTHTDDRADLAAKLRDQDTETLIVDPFGRAYTGQSQNDAGEVGSWLVDLDLFTRGEVGAHDLILPAHAGWNGERTRGASALEDWADTIITLTRDPDDESLRFMKAIGRDVDIDEDQLAFDENTRHLSLTGNGSRKQRAASQKNTEVLQEIVETLKVSPGYNTSELERSLRARGVPLQKGDVAKACRAGLADGVLTMETGARGAKQYHLPRRTPTYPDGASPTYPDPPLYGGVGGEGRSTTHLPRTICTTCGQPMEELGDGTSTHPNCSTGGTR